MTNIHRGHAQNSRTEQVEHLSTQDLSTDLPVADI